LLVYSILLALSLAGASWRGRSIFFASPDAEQRGVAPLLDVALGLAVALAVIALSHWIAERTRWGDALARVLAGLLGMRSRAECALLALLSGCAEEAFFRGLLQPELGWLLASLVFGVAHFAPRRELLPWTGFAVGAGLAFGALFEWTGNLVAPVVAHVAINAVNLRRLVVRYGR
jgi:hypothetical protein